MKFFNFNLRDKITLEKIEDNADYDYSMMCMEYNKIINRYFINHNLHSEKFWKYLKDEWNIIDESNIIVKSEISFDEKNREYKYYKYYIKLNTSKNIKIFFIFYDEYRNLSDDDYHKFVPKDEKSDKISGLQIFYDSDEIETKWIEKNIIDKLKNCVHLSTTKNQFFTITTGAMGYELKSSYIKDVDIDLKLNYGTDFMSIHNEIVNKLQNEKHGLFLLHGKTGTGKTHYLRKLISLLSEDKLIIYVPSYMLYDISSPQFMSFISSFKNTILILEDSEFLLKSNERTQAISNILNITDGLLGDYMETQIICTFNVEVEQIDKALTRAGRLYINYEFDELNPEQATKLSKKLNKNVTYVNNASLSEIYDGENQIINVKKRKKIGFN